MARDRAASHDESAYGADEPTAAPSSELVCGLVMPLATTDECPPQHWAEVRSIIQEAVGSIEKYKFTCDMVSNANESAVIQTNIVQNLYSNAIVVCDVSGRNPNVMFELGMRVAFDKPVVIVKDDRTDFSFDTSPVAHLIYPRDLRYGAMQVFKADLASKVSATYQKHVDGGSGSSYLASFGPIKVANLQTQEVPLGDLVVGRLNQMQDQLNQLISMSEQPRKIAGVNSLLANALRDYRPTTSEGPPEIGRSQLTRMRNEIIDRIPHFNPSDPDHMKQACSIVSARLGPAWSHEEITSITHRTLNS
ncbi:hypothetical protein M5J07_20740 [Achromobacter mucicolens]|uniref:hypothetical protein n=1 Tax=Achromobacter mucicolens TaxID=1389922 RepID=UPI0020A4ED32|nr:hypothetical protein [Achromobacter mucicolens]MCP2517379.1 hypothetical protein [Achromobacter mucicolens]